VARGRRLSENKVVLLINEDFGPQNSKTLHIGLHGEVEPVQKTEHYSRNCGQHSKYTGGQVMEYRPCIISYRLAGSVKMRPILTGGRLTRVANFTGVIIFPERMKDKLWPQELAPTTPGALYALESRPSLRAAA